MMIYDIYCFEHCGDSACFCVVARDAVVAMDRHDGMEVEEFLPQRRSRTYGIAITYPQCPAGLS